MLRITISILQCLSVHIVTDHRSSIALSFTLFFTRVPFVDILPLVLVRATISVFSVCCGTIGDACCRDDTVFVCTRVSCAVVMVGKLSWTVICKRVRNLCVNCCVFKTRLAVCSRALATQEG
jgi:hypothetical protein